MALPLSKLPPIGSQSPDGSGRVIPYVPPVASGRTGNNANGQVTTAKPRIILPFPNQGGKGMVQQIQRPETVPEGHVLTWMHPALHKDLTTHFAESNPTAVVAHTALSPIGSANESVPLPGPELPPIGPDPAGPGSTAPSNPVPTGEPVVEIPTGPHDEPLPVGLVEPTDQPRSNQTAPAPAAAPANTASTAGNYGDTNWTPNWFRDGPRLASTGPDINRLFGAARYAF